MPTIKKILRNYHNLYFYGHLKSITSHIVLAFALLALSPIVNAQTFMHDIGGNNGDFLILGSGTMVTYYEGAMGTGLINAGGTGQEDGELANATEFRINLAATDNNGGGSDYNTGTWTNYGYVHLNFSGSVILNQTITVGDLDGQGTAPTARDQVAIFALDSNGNLIAPLSSSFGSGVVLGSRTMSSTPLSLGLEVDLSGEVIGSATASGTHNSLMPNDVLGHYTVDFGLQEITDLVYLYQIPGTVGSGYSTEQKVTLLPVNLDLVTPVPEPSGALLLGLTATLAVLRRRRVA